MVVKFIHISDIHGGFADLETIRKYAEKAKADAVLFSGDMLGPCISGPQAQEMNNHLETIVNSIPKDKKFKSLDEFLQYCEKNPETKEAAKGYRAIEKKFDEKAKAHYTEAKKAISQFSKPVLMVPGNWDSTQFLEEFKNYCIHGKVAEIKGLRIAGYGSANVIPKMLPQTRFVYYDESEFSEFLNQAKPDVILSHMPPKGIVDGKSKIGSEALRKYLEKQNPKLVVCGHSHDYGHEQAGKTMVSNAGNLGKYFNQKHYGTFAEIEIDGNKVVVRHYQIQKGEIQEIKEELRKAA